MSFIVTQSKKIMGNAIDRYAKTWGAEPRDMGLLLRMKGESEIEYSLMRQFRIEKELSIMDILGVKIDFKGYSMIAPPFIRKSMERMCGQYNVPPADLSVIILKPSDVKMYSYNKGNCIGEVTFEYLFGGDL